MPQVQNTRFPLTSPQREIWFDQILHQDIPLYNIGGYVKIPGAIDPLVFEQAVNLLVQKHDILRTMLTDDVDEDGLPMQAYVDGWDRSVTVVGFSAEACPHDAAMVWMKNRFIEPFEFGGQPLFRYDLIRLADDQYCWLLQYHHLIIDGWGIALLNRSLAEVYTKLANGQAPSMDAPSYVPFINDDRAYVESEHFKQQRQYWLNQFPTAPEPLLDPRYRAQYKDRLIGSGCESLFLSRDFYDRLNDLAKQHKATLFHVLLGALYVYFTRTAGRDDFAIGLPVLNRANGNFKSTAGLFTGVSPALFNFGRTLSFADLLQQISKTLNANYRHQRYPVSEINRAVGLGQERSQLFDVSLSFESYDYDACFNGLESHFSTLLPSCEQIPLMISIRDFHIHHDVECNFMFNLAYFNSDEIQALQARFITILEAVLKDSLSPVSNVPIMSEPEIKQLQLWNDTATDYPKDKTIVDLFEQQVEKTPDNIAVVFPTTGSGGVGWDGEQSLTYRQLNVKANQLAHYLLALKIDDGELLLVNNPLVAIAVERSLDMVIGLLAILKAGGAYVPIDPAYPSARIAYMLGDSAAPLLLTQSYLIKQLTLAELEHECVMLCLDEMDVTRQGKQNPRLNSQAQDLAYVIYTSGSTGKPKGVCIPNAAVLRLVINTNYIQLNADDRIAQASNISFDAATFEIWGSLLNGAQLIGTSKNIILSPNKLIQHLSAYQINTLFVTTALFNQIAQTKPECFKLLKTLMFGGERVDPHWVDYVLNNNSPKRLLHVYGPTETTTFASWYLVSREERRTGTDTIPIGSAISNTHIYILNKQNQLQPHGISGELCIAGAGLARGYLNRPELTAEKFREVELFGKIERIYKTGDLARWLPDGNLEYLGRIDQQVKLRGFRIELGEIEAVISQYISVKETVVNLYEADDNKRLVAYFTTDSAADKLIAELKDMLKSKLPDYMIPSNFVHLAAIPLTPNGKVDRNALPAPEFRVSESFALPSTATEELLATIWASVFKCESISRFDNFFKLGGHSLLATQLIARIRESFQVELAIRTVFEYPELSNLAVAIENSSGTMNLPSIERQATGAAKVLSFGQEWFWFLNQYDSKGTAHIMSFSWKLTGELNLKALQQTFCDLVERHQSLRLSFPQIDGQVTVAQLAAYDPLTLINMSEKTEAERSQVLDKLLNDSINKAFSLENEPLFRVHVLKLSSQESLLFLTIHHIIFDGWSMGILLQEWRTLYTAYHQQQTPHLPELPIQYADYAAWQRACLQGDLLQQQLDYWVTKLNGAPELLGLPTDFPRPETQQNIGGVATLKVSKELTDKLSQLARQQGCTLQMVLLSCFALLLQRYSGQKDICIGIPLVMRHQRQTEHLLGLFLNMLVLRTQVSVQDTFIDLLKQVRQNSLDAYSHQDMPFKHLVEHLRPQRQTAYNPYFQVMFNLVNTPNDTAFELPDLHIESWGENKEVMATSNLDIVFSLQENSTGIEGSIVFDKGLFKAETINYWVEGYVALLEQAVNQPEAMLTQFALVQNATARYPLTSTQREIWFDQLIHDDIPLYNIGGYVKIPGVVNVEWFEQAINVLVQKHDTLRTLLLKERDEDGVPLQTYAESLVVKVPLHDFSTQSHEVAEKWMQTRFIEPFQLIEKPLFRYDLIRLADDKYYWLLQYHHLIIDGYGIALLNRSLADIYTKLANGQAPNLDAPSYTPFINDDRAYVESERFKKQRQYWMNQYPKAPEPLLDPRYRAQYKGRLIGSGCESLYLPRDFYDRLNNLAKQHGATLFHVLLGALYVYFTRTADRDDFAIGLPVLNRANGNFKNTAGLFTGVSPALFNFGRELSFSELLQQISKTLKANYRHQRFPVSEINRAVGLGQERSQLFDVSLSYESHDYDACFNELDSHTTLFLHPWEQTPLMIFVRDFHAQADVKFDFVFNHAYFNIDDIEALQARFVTVLEAVLKDNLSPVSNLPIMTEPEVQQLQLWNDTATDYPKDKTIVDLFEQQVEKIPDNIAVVFPLASSPSTSSGAVGRDDEQLLTYRQLNEKANQLAHYLLGLKSHDGEALLVHNPLVAIAVERSLDMVIGLLAILKAGGAYVPIDPAYPSVRIRHMLDDSTAPLLLTQSHLMAQLSQGELQNECVVVCLDEVNFTKLPTENLAIDIQIEYLAYVIYTSGSTGVPKGVALEHSSLSNLLQDMQQRIGITANDKLMALTTLSFDIAALELYLPLISGSILHLATREVASDALLLKQHLKKHGINFMQATPATWQLLKHAGWSTDSALNVICGGEALSAELANYLLKNSTCLWNVYGPTETTVWSSAFRIRTPVKNTPLIGQPIGNTRIYILDTDNHTQPSGIAGELCIAGSGLAHGYLNRPELTAEKFIEVELFGKLERIYKTGDLARWLPDGNLQYLGRMDQQVKLRGFRIELGEIEAIINQHGLVKEVVVNLCEADDNKRLVAYFTSDSGVDQLIAELKEMLKSNLPDYMVPSSFVHLDAIPLTSNGKIDRKALPAPEYEVSTGSVLPVTTTEELLATIWAAVLKCESIGRFDSFFELGGHSLLATQLIARIRDSFQIDLPIRTIFEHPKLSDLATAIDAAVGGISLPAIEAQRDDAVKVLSFAQQRLWFLDQFEGEGNVTYNMPYALQLSGELDVDALQQSLLWLVERHTSLRSYFPSHSGEAHVLVQTMDEVDVLNIHDLSHLPCEAQEQDIQTKANKHAIEPFDLARGPLFKAELLQLGEHQAVLLLNIHHIISDGWSMGVFVRDWQHSYTAFVQGEQPSLPPLAIQYSDYAVWQRNWLQGSALQQQVDYWQEKLRGIPELIELPTDKKRPAQQSYQGSHYIHVLPVSLSHDIATLSRQQSVTLFMTLLTTFNILLSRYSRQNDVCIGSPIANRTHSHNEDLIGFFVNTLVLRSQVEPDQSFIELLKATRQTCLEAYAHQDIPFETLVEALQPTRSLSHSPLFQVMFVLQNIDSNENQFTLPDLDIKSLETASTIAKFDLTLNIEEYEGKLHCLWEYATDLFEASTIIRMAQHFELLLSTIVNHSEQAVSQLSMLTEPEVQQLQLWNDTEADYPKDKTIVDLFEQQVEKIPDNIAVVFEETSLTYRQLNEKANQLAHYLLALKTDDGELLLVHNPLVAIAVDRSLDMVIGLLAILKAGGAYVPIDPAYPSARIQHMLDDSAASLLLTQRHLTAQLAVDELQHDCVVICLDEVDSTKLPTVGLAIDVQIDHLAYVIYTSGSTGIPKGVAIEHDSLSNLLQDMQQRIGITANDKLMALTTLSFDIAALELYLPLISGSVLHIASREVAGDAVLLKQCLKKYSINFMQATPATWQLLKHADWSADGALNVICGGEALSAELANYLLENSACLWNVYGPTETTVWSSAFRIRSPVKNTPLIGQPIGNTRVYILNAENQLQPSGIPGELCIAGSGLARGYLNRPELTADKFINVELFGKHERIYKTGDLAHWLPDGNLEYLGRMDHQIKLRGFRIELGEVESVLIQHSYVKEAVVSLYDDARLVAYVVGGENQGSQSRINELRKWLRLQLPEYMVPAEFIQLESLPLTPNGKIDRANLPSPELHRDDKILVSPRTITEEIVMGIWIDLLKTHDGSEFSTNMISINDDFFAIGGHSLITIVLVSRIKEILSVQISIRELFEYRTIESLAICIEQAQQRMLLKFQHEEDEFLYLSPLQTSGSKNPAYIVNGGTGKRKDFIYWARVVYHLGINQPVYGLSSPDDNMALLSTKNAEVVASAYLADIKQFQPHGPYILIGECIGGMLAFEMARQLQANGDKVHLILIDTVNIHRKYNRLIHEIIRRLKITAIQQQWNLIRQEKIIAWPSFMVNKIKRLVARRYTRSTLPDSPIDLKDQNDNNYLYDLSLNYRPENYSGHIDLLVSESNSSFDPYAGWKKTPGLKLDIHKIEGVHPEYLNKHARHAAKTLNDILTSIQ